MAEKDLQMQCVAYARSKDLMIYSINPPDFKHKTYGTLNQLPDLHIVDFNAYFELKDSQYKKAHKERQEMQLKRRKELAKHNAVVYKLDTFEKFKTVIDWLTNG